MEDDKLNYYKSLTKNYNEMLVDDYSDEFLFCDFNLSYKYSYLEDFLRLIRPYYSPFEFIYDIIGKLSDPNLQDKINLVGYRALRDVLAFHGNDSAIRGINNDIDSILKYFGDCKNISYVGTGVISMEPIIFMERNKGEDDRIINVYDPRILPTIISKMVSGHNGIFHRQNIWNIPDGVDLAIFDDVCPNTEYFISKLILNDEVNAIFRLCNNFQYIYDPDNSYTLRGSEVISVDDFLELMLKKYKDKGLEYVEEKGNHVLVKKAFRKN